MNRIKSKLILVVIFAIAPGAYAQENPFHQSAQLAARGGGVQGGGGDIATEGQIKKIREDLKVWVSVGGAKNLHFTNGVDYETYLNGNKLGTTYGMNDILSDGAVVINSIRESEMLMDDDEMNTYVDGFPKTCKGFISKKDQRPHMLCNIDRFWQMKPRMSSADVEDEQYRQVHHEYAGLGKLEINVGSDSDYSISNQIAASLETKTIRQLVVKRTTAGVVSKCSILYAGNDEQLIRAFEKKNLTIVQNGPAQLSFNIEIANEGFTTHAPTLFFTHKNRGRKGMEFQLNGGPHQFYIFKLLTPRLDISGSELKIEWKQKLYDSTKREFLEALRGIPACK